MGYPEGTLNTSTAAPVCARDLAAWRPVRLQKGPDAGGPSIYGMRCREIS